VQGWLLANGQENSRMNGRIHKVAIVYGYYRTFFLPETLGNFIYKDKQLQALFSSGTYLDESGQYLTGRKCMPKIVSNIFKQKGAWKNGISNRISKTND
jgi:hypothetical protein